MSSSSPQPRTRPSRRRQQQPKEQHEVVVDGGTADGKQRPASSSSSSSWFGLGWLAAEEGHPKHQGWLHPIVACLLVTVSVTAFMVRLAEAVAPPPPAAAAGGAKPPQVYAALGLAAYTAVLFLARVLATGSYALYEFLWACNQALLLAALGLATARPLLVAAGVIAVSVDQVLWYVDVLGFLLTLGRKFPIGVAKYLTWPETSWARRITSTHHMWFIPYCLALGQGRLPLAGYFLSVAFVAVLDVMCRWVTPFRLPASPPPTLPTTPSPSAAGTVVEASNKRRRSLRLLQQQHQLQQQPKGQADASKGGGDGGGDGGGGGGRYLNVNLVYELWKDIDVGFLKVSHPHPAIHLTRLIVLWSLLNVPFAAVIFPLSGWGVKK